MNVRSLLLVFGSLLLLSACGGSEATYEYPEYMDPTGRPTYDEPESIFGEGGILLLGERPAEPDAGGAGIGVNAFLWRATLDTLSFMPLASADPFGGVVITDWYTPPDSPDERFRINAFILGRDLRADGVRISVFRQQRDGAGGWSDAAVGDGTAREIEDAILTRARQLRIAGMD